VTGSRKIVVPGLWRRPKCAKAPRLYQTITMPSRAFGQGQQNIRKPGAVQTEPLVDTCIASPNVQPRRMNTQQHPWQRAIPIGRAVHSHDDRRAAHAPMRSRIRQKLAFSLKPQIEARREDRMSRDRQLVQFVLETQGKADDQQRSTDHHFPGPGQMIDRKCMVDEVGGQSGAIQRDHRDVDITRRIVALSPDTASIAVQGNLEVHQPRDVVPIRVQCNADEIREVLAGLVPNDMTTRHQKQTFVSLEEESAGIRQGLSGFECQYLDGRQQQGVDHTSSASIQQQVGLLYGLSQPPFNTKSAERRSLCLSIFDERLAESSPSAGPWHIGLWL
jgi:hypothetical protein